MPRNQGSLPVRLRALRNNASLGILPHRAVRGCSSWAQQNHKHDYLSPRKVYPTYPYLWDLFPPSADAGTCGVNRLLH